MDLRDHSLLSRAREAGGALNASRARDTGGAPNASRAREAGGAPNSAGLFDRYDSFILDMDGTLARGESLLSGVPEFLRAASHAKKRLVVLTDNSTRPRDEIAERLRSTGIPFNADQVVTSSHAAAVELYRLLGSCRVYLIGEKALADDLTQLGHEVVTTAPADAVVVGFTSRFDYTSLAKALPILASGAPLIVTDEAPVYAAPQGTMPGAGSLVGAFRGMGYAPVVVAGKPHGAAVDLALKATGTPRDKVALIGDSLPSDGGAAQHLGVSFVLVLTGVSTAEDAILAAGPPDHVCATLADASSRNAR